MKTRFFNLMTLAAMAACTMMTGCKDEKADQLQKERDSLAELTSSQALAINEVNSTLGEISLMMDSISLQENALFIINNDKNEVQNRHERIKGNIKNFEDMLKRHKARIAELEARLDGNSKETANLKNIIQLMKSQIRQRYRRTAGDNILTGGSPVCPGQDAEPGICPRGNKEGTQGLGHQNRRQPVQEEQDKPQQPADRQVQGGGHTQLQTAEHTRQESVPPLTRSKLLLLPTEGGLRLQAGNQRPDILLEHFQLSGHPGRLTRLSYSLHPKTRRHTDFHGVKPPLGLVNSEFLMEVHFWLSKYHPALLGYEELNPDIRPKHDEE